MAHRDLTDLDVKTFNRLRKKRCSAARRRPKHSGHSSWRGPTLLGGGIVSLLFVATAAYSLIDRPEAPAQASPNTDSGKILAIPDDASTKMDGTLQGNWAHSAINSLSMPNKGQGDASSTQQATLTPSTDHPPNLSRDDVISSENGQQSLLDSLLRHPSAERTAPSSSHSRSGTAESAPEPPPQWQAEEITVRRGDSLARIIARAGFSARVSHQVMNSGDAASHLRNIHPGQKLTIFRDNKERFAGLEYHVDTRRTLKVKRSVEQDPEQGLQSSLVSRQVQRHRIRTEEPLLGSLYLTARRAGLSDQMTMNLAGILSWEIDLGRQLRKNDRLAIIYDKIKSPDGELLDTEIQAVSYRGRNAELEAIRFEKADGQSSYYNPDGDNLRRELKRYPVDYTRISSHFDLNRRHPILGVRRPHLGVDLAAPTGTPVYAAGDGRVVERGRNGGYGRVVSIEHGSGYKTLYAHLNGYARGLRVGDRVQRGQLIGYVGQSGTATGPHLHYEVIVNGRHRDPVKVDLPKAEPLTDDYLAKFLSHAKPLVQALRDPDSGDDEIKIASND
ncbi:M23 family metallopeptidase [Halorhodospira halochloris]|uniref:M23 family metallopeptidase n=1 Tax=Halorhodospira halochloris TaxID=1052 RepID=UPI001EE8CD13|nr:M23 family metallopeptidase [Halorhodospira halochloris]MCG5529529.1 M23 family metallopeptidase [Halorhodospira halochloris]